MKIRILQDIPGYKAGDIIVSSEGSEAVNLTTHGYDNITCHYNYDYLLKNGWAEEVKDIDIKEIRERFFSIAVYYPSIGNPETMEDRKFYMAYLVVKTTINLLNKEAIVNPYGTYAITSYLYGGKMFFDVVEIQQRHSILPIIESRDVAEEVIKLCEPELKVLFRVK